MIVICQLGHSFISLDSVSTHKRQYLAVLRMAVGDSSSHLMVAHYLQSIVNDGQAWEHGRPSSDLEQEQVHSCLMCFQIPQFCIMDQQALKIWMMGSPRRLRFLNGGTVIMGQCRDPQVTELNGFNRSQQYDSRAFAFILIKMAPRKMMRMSTVFNTMVPYKWKPYEISEYADKCSAYNCKFERVTKHNWDIVLLGFYHFILANCKSDQIIISHPKFVA